MSRPRQGGEAGMENNSHDSRRILVIDLVCQFENKSATNDKRQSEHQVGKSLKFPD
jgi:hypothetical protein